MEEEYFDPEIANLQDVDVTSTQCPNCGANIAFDPNSQSLKCDYCGNIVDFEQSKSSEKQSIEGLTKTRDIWAQSTKSFSCNSCGAVAILSHTDIAMECPYCRSTNIVPLEGLSGTKPDSLLPFSIDRQQAGNIASEWAKGKFFAPNPFKASFAPDNLRGIYNPSFVFDSKTFSSYKGSLGKHYTVTVGSGKNRHTEIRTRWFRVSGTHYDNHVDVTIQASQKVDTRTMSKLAPFDVSKAQKYNDAYLQGFTANHYDKDGLKCWDDAKIIIDAQAYKGIMKSLRAKYNFDVVGKFDIKTQCYDIKYEYTLLPIWVGHTKYAKKDFNYFINGVTGRLTGKTPKSARKIWAVIGICAGIVLAVNIFALIASR